MTRQQTLMFQLAQAQLRAELNDMDFPKDVRDQTNPLLAEVLALDPPKRLPPGPVTYLGANAVMRWGEMKAGREM